MSLVGVVCPWWVHTQAYLCPGPCWCHVLGAPWSAKGVAEHLGTFILCLVFKLRGMCSLPRSLKSSCCTTKMPCCCTHLLSVEVTSCNRQSWRISLSLRPSWLSSTHTEVHMCVCVYICAYICIYIVSVCIEIFCTETQSLCHWEVDAGFQYLKGT